MDFSYILCFLCLIFGIFDEIAFISCTSAVAVCPVRAVSVSAPEAKGVKECACRRGFYGENCRFKGDKFNLITM